MQPHIPTLFAVLTATTLALALAVAFIGHKKHPDLQLWAAALGVQSLAYLLLGLRGSVPDALSVLGGNVCASASLALFALAIRRFRQHDWPLWWAWLPVAAVAIGFAVWLDRLEIRLVWGSVVYFAQCLLLGHALLRQRTHALDRGSLLVLWGTALLVGTVVLRLVAFTTGLVLAAQAQRGGPIQYLTLFCAITSTLLLSVGLIIMNEERAERALLANERYQTFRNQILEMLAQGLPLQTLMQALIQGIEALHPNMICSIQRLDRLGKHLQDGYAPGLPDFFNAAVQGLAIGPTVGSCGAAAYTRQRVVVEDVSQHPNWAPYRALTAQAGVGACWSQPILSSDQQVLGTFAIYHRSPHKPTQADIELIEQSAWLASIAIERSTAAQQLLERERHYRLLIETANEGIAVFQSGLLRFGNPRFFKMCGQPADALLNRPFEALVHPDDRDLVRECHRLCLLGQSSPQPQTFRVPIPQQGVRWFELNGAPFEWQGQPASLCFMSDVTERRLMQEQIQRQALHDDLTELPNRRLLNSALALSMANHKRNGLHGALMFVDLDNFKPLNDTWGHKVGDLLLVNVAQRLRQSVREIDTVARFGGDEFVVLLNDLSTDLAASTEQARVVAHKLLALLEQPHRLTLAAPNGADTVVEHRCTASIGVVMFKDRPAEPDEVLKQADMAMYRAKQAGRNTVWIEAVTPG